MERNNGHEVDQVLVVDSEMIDSDHSRENGDSGLDTEQAMVKEMTPQQRVVYEHGLIRIQAIRNLRIS